MDSSELKKVFFWGVDLLDDRKVSKLKEIKNGKTRTKIYRGAYKEKTIIVSSYDKENNQLVGEVSGYYKFSFKIQKSGKVFKRKGVELHNHQTNKAIVDMILKWTFEEPIIRTVNNRVNSTKKKNKSKKQNRGYYIVKRLVGLTDESLRIISQEL